ncbi:hypothetical protein ABEG18_22020 [Alsobacter sp. KACC 23698]|uniref:Uncharacterized protein n=1 Tax=Alsobacter sp. KACC 23698 TaxID=3149229 RepID=A0AAU7JD98_9HYPH
MSDWYTYAEAAKALGISTEAARQRAARFGWRRQLGNDGKARVQVPEEAIGSDRPVKRPDERPMSAPDDRTVDRPDDRAALTAHIETLKAEVARLDALAAEHRADLRQERSRADQAMAELAKMAERLLELERRRARPWWRRLAG